MIHRLIVLIIFVLLSRCADAAMLRVVAIRDAQTIAVNRNGQVVDVKLAGIAIDDAAAAHDLLSWSLANEWVLIEEQPGGGQLVWRTPDGMFINRELVLRGYARATIAAVRPPQHSAGRYLGIVMPEGAQRSITRRRESGSDKSPRLKAPPKPKRRPHR